MIPVNEPLFIGNEAKYLKECIETGWVSSDGSFVKRFEAEFAGYCDRKYGVSVVNGTAALQLAFESLKLQAGDEVILPSFTIISCASCIDRLGLIPVPVDCNPHTYNMTIEHVEAAYTEKTKAILVVHIYGLPVDVDPILQFAKEKELYVIEDAAEMIGQEYKGRKCGSFGDVSVFSFYANKHITTGEGGMVVMDNDDIHHSCLSGRNLAFKPPRRFVHDELGWNYRMTNLQAAVGVAQLETIDQLIVIKREIGVAYTKLLTGVDGISLPVHQTNYANNIYWVYSIVLDETFPAMAGEVEAKLNEKGIGTRPFFWPIHQQPYFLDKYPHWGSLSLPNSEHIAKNGFYVPSGLGLNQSKIPTICKEIKDVLKSF